MAATVQARRGEAGLEVRPTRDRTLLLPLLEQDRLLAAYALCDLDPREFGRTRWGIALDAGRPVGLVLEYLGPSPQPLFLAGDPAAVARVLRDVIVPRAAWIAGSPAHLAEAEPVYRIDPGPPMIRMVVDAGSFEPAGRPAERLGPRDIGELNRLYDLGPAAWLPASTVAEGVYYGIREGDRIVAAAGTHVIGDAVGLAAVGNVMTRADRRGRGHATAVTSAVTAELLGRCPQVVLNVRADNPAALAVYRSLGYREHVRFEERLARRRGTVWDSITMTVRRFAARRTE